MSDSKNIIEDITQLEAQTDDSVQPPPPNNCQILDEIGVN